MFCTKIFLAPSSTLLFTDCYKDYNFKSTFWFWLVQVGVSYRLGKLATAQEPKLIKVFPKDSEDERNRFELLQKAYKNSRYDENFSITREDLEWLEERVIRLQELTEKICKKLESFK